MGEDKADPRDSLANIATALGGLLDGDYTPVADVTKDAAARRERLNHRLTSFEMRRPAQF